MDIIQFIAFAVGGWVFGWFLWSRHSEVAALILRWNIVPRIEAQIPGIPRNELHELLKRIAGLVRAFERVDYSTIVMCRYNDKCEQSPHFQNSIANLKTRSVIMDFDGIDPDVVYCVGFGYGEVCYEEESPENEIRTNE